MKDRRPKRLDAAGIWIVKQFEGLRLQVYLDAAGLSTIGWGHLIPKGRDFSGGITAEQAEALLRSDLLEAEAAVNGGVGVPMGQNEFDALVSLAFNIGGSAFLGSSVLRLLNAEDREGAADAFLRWNKIRKKGKGLVVSPGLARRRELERSLFLTPDATEPEPNAGGALA